MTARTLLERAGCLAIELARRAGIDEKYWGQMLHRDTPLTTARSPERGSRIAGALDDLIKEMQQLSKDIKRG